MKAKINPAHYENQIKPFSEQLIIAAICQYLEKQFQSEGQEKDSGEFSYPFGDLYFKKTTLGQIEERQAQLLQDIRPVLNLSSDLLIEELKTRNIPVELINLINEAAGSASQTIVVDDLRKVSEQQPIDDPDYKIEERLRSEITYQLPDSTVEENFAYLNNELACTLLESGFSWQQVEIVLRGYSGFMRSMDNFKPGISKCTNPRDFSTNFYASCVERLEKYTKACGLEMDLPKNFSIADIESQFYGKTQYWLLQFTSTLCHMSDEHLGIHFVIMEWKSALLEQQKYLYVQELQKFHEEIYIIHNALFNLNLHCPLTSLYESRAFDLIIIDIRAITHNYLKALNAYCTQLIAKATSSEKMIINQYIIGVLNVIMPFLHAPESKDNLIAIVNDKIKDVEGHILYCMKNNQGGANHRVIWNHYNGDYNLTFLRALYNSISLACGDLSKIGNQLNKPIVIQPAPTPQKKSHAARRKPHSTTQSSRTQGKPAPEKTGQREESPSVIYEPSTIHRARRHWMPSSSNSKLVKKEEWTAVTHKPKPLNAAFEKIQSRHYDDAIKLFEKISPNSPDDYNQAQYGLARCFEEKAEYLKAYQVLDNMAREWKGNFNHQMTFGRICLTLGHVKQAQLIFTTMSQKWKNNELVLRFRAKCHQALGEEASAASIYEWLSKKNPNLSNSIDLAHSYSRIGKHQAAMDRLNQLSPDDQKENTVLFARVAIHQKLGQFNAALKLLEQCKQKNDEQFVTSYVKCLIKMGRHKTAWKALNDALNKFGKTQELMYAGVKYYTAKNDYGNAIAQLEKMNATWPNNKGILLELAYFYSNAKNYAKAVDYCQLLIEYYPLFLQGHLQLLINKSRLLGPDAYEEILSGYEKLIAINEFKEDVNLFYNQCYFILQSKEYAFAEEQIRSSMRRFPFEQRFYVLMVRCLLDENRFSEAFEELTKALNQFPDNPQLHIQQIKLYCKTGSSADINLLISRFKADYAGNERLCNKIDKIYSSTKPVMNNDYQAPPVKRGDEVNKPAMTVTLPGIVLEAFRQLKQVPGRVVLNGGTTIKLVQKQLAGEILHDVTELRDLDFTIDCDPEELMKKIPGMRRSVHNTNLFTFQLSFEGQTILVDCVLHRDKNNWLLSNTVKRDYTIYSLQIEETETEGFGYVYDLTERGINDIKNAVLDTCCFFPSFLFETDPSCIPRAFKNSGFTPTNEVREAIRSWSGSNSNLHYGHLLAIIMRHLRENPQGQIQYLQSLHEHGFLLKVFSEHLPELVHRDLRTEEIDAQFSYQFFAALNEQYQSQRDLGFYNVCDKNPMHDLTALLDEMKISAEKAAQNGKGKKKEKTVPPLDDLKAWPRPGRFFDDRVEKPGQSLERIEKPGQPQDWAGLFFKGKPESVAGTKVFRPNNGM